MSRLDVLPPDVVENVLGPMLLDRATARLAVATCSPVFRRLAMDSNAGILYRFGRALASTGMFAYKEVWYTKRKLSDLACFDLVDLHFLKDGTATIRRCAVGSSHLDGLKDLRVELVLENIWSEYPDNVSRVTVEVTFEDWSEAPLRFDCSQTGVTVWTRHVLVLKPHAEDLLRAFTKGFCGGLCGGLGRVTRTLARELTHEIPRTA